MKTTTGALIRIQQLNAMKAPQTDRFWKALVEAVCFVLLIFGTVTLSALAAPAPGAPAAGAGAAGAAAPATSSGAMGIGGPGTAQGINSQNANRPGNPSTVNNGITSPNQPLNGNMIGNTSQNTVPVPGSNFPSTAQTPNPGVTPFPQSTPNQSFPGNYPLTVPTPRI